MKAVKLLIKGKVQSVGYRRWFEKEALQLNLMGYVKNLPTGEVEAIIVGEESSILTLIRHSYVGPLRAKVESIEQIAFENVGEFSDFKMLRE